MKKGINAATWFYSTSFHDTAYDKVQICRYCGTQGDPHDCPEDYDTCDTAEDSAPCS
jgi:hypothetical protein